MRRNRRADVLVTYGWVRSSYAALRNLTSHGIGVLAADSKPIGMCQASRLKVGFQRYCSHYLDEDRFLADIERIVRQHDVGILMPSHNETEVLARAKHRFPKASAVLLPHAAHCELFNNKASSYALAKSLGIPVPPRIEYCDPRSIADELRKADIQRSVIKLLTGNSSKGVYFADTPESAQNIAADLISRYQLHPTRYPQIEAEVEGEGWGCSVLYWEGERIAWFTHRRLREKFRTGGTSTLRQAAAHSALESSAKQIFDRAGWHGLAMCEFKVCPKTGRHWFIEVNPRLWGSISLAIEAGVEFPYLAWLCATKGPLEAQRHFDRESVRHGWRARWLLGDAMVAAGQLSRGRMAAAVSTLLTPVDSTDDLYWDDPLPFLGEALSYANSVIRERSFNPEQKGMVG